ncbi:putative reverse transcriptase, RNA-dependent DNA polymerase [Tanacetum coccineum]
MVFHQMDTEEVSDRFVAPCFVNGLESYDGEINLGVEENMISNEYVVKLCLEHEVKRGNKVVKKELIVALRDDVPLLGGEELSPFVCKIGKSNRNKKRSMENLNLFYQDIGTSSSAGGHLTQEEAAKEALPIRISQKFALLEEVRPVIETMAYNDNYKKILDEICKDKVELDGKIVKEEEEAVKRIKGEALKEKDDLGAFIFPIRLEGKVNKNALADTGSDINTMPYRIYKQLGREEMMKVDRGITMINHTQAETIGILTNVLCRVAVTTLIAKFLILDIPINRDAPIVVGKGFLRTINGIVNTLERLFLTFDGFCHQTFRAARSDVMRNAESDSDDEEEYQIKKNKFGSPIYGPKLAPYLNYNDPAERSLAIQTVTNPFRKISVWKKAISFLGSLPVPLKHTIGTHDDEAGSSRSKRSKQHETVKELCHEFYSTYKFDKVCAEDELQTKKIIKFRLGGRAHNLTLLEFVRRLGLYHADELEEDGFNVYFEGGLRSDEHFNAQ